MGDQVRIVNLRNHTQFNNLVGDATEVSDKVHVRLHTSQEIKKFRHENVEKVGLDTKRVEDCERFNVMSTLLHSNTHKLSSMDDANLPIQSQNVRIARDIAPDNATMWDGTCCIKGTNKGTFVAVENFSRNKLHGIG